jgi:cell division protein FtsB
VERDDDRSSRLLRDFTTAIPNDRRLINLVRGRLLIGLLAVLICSAITAALFVLPVRSWMQQNDDIDTRSAELQKLADANSDLATEVERLQTDDGIREAIREELDYVNGGEQRITVLPLADPSTVLPPGWPYDTIRQIIAIRQAEAVGQPSS